VINTLFGFSSYLPQADNYVLGFQQNNSIVPANMSVYEDLNLVLMERSNGVVVEFEEGLSEENISDIVNEVSALIGQNPDDILVEYETDEEGNILSIVLYVMDSSTTTLLVNTINSLDKETCEGALCQAKRAYRARSEESLDKAIQHEPLTFIQFILFITALVHIIVTMK